MRTPHFHFPYTHLSLHRLSFTVVEYKNRRVPHRVVCLSPHVASRTAHHQPPSWGQLSMSSQSHVHPGAFIPLDSCANKFQCQRSAPHKWADINHFRTQNISPIITLAPRPHVFPTNHSHRTQCIQPKYFRINSKGAGHQCCYANEVRGALTDASTTMLMN